MLNEWTNSANQEIKPTKMSRNYYCVDCKISTRNPRIYLEHRRDIHRDSITIHNCTLCVYASKHSQKLTRHMRTVHRDVIQGSGRLIRQSIANPPEMMSSLQCDKSARISTCKVCGLYTTNKSILMQHIHTDHPEIQIYKCDQCEYSHYIRDRYNRHHRYHSMNYVQCKLCEFQTIYRWNLERHMRHHIDNVSMGFRCKKCNFTASTKQSITAHEIAHHSGLKVRPQEQQQQQQQQQQNNNESNVSQTMTSTMNSTMVNDLIKQKNSEVDDDIMNDDDADGASDFDANDFLEIVFDNNTSKPKDSSAMQTVTVKQESNKTKFYYCFNCNFRNEIEWNQSTTDELSTACPSVNPIEQQTSNSRYRCGYCHQSSNWKHVIERHCRLVHNTSGLIEKFSAEERSYNPTKRRLDRCMETATTTKKMVKCELDEKPVTRTKQKDNSDIGVPSSFN